MNGHVEFRDEIAAYVLGALEEHEAVLLSSHLTECLQCRGEYERLRFAADGLAVVVPQFHAPETLKEHVMSVVRSESELLRSATDDVPAARRWRLPRWLGPVPMLASAAAAAAVAIVVLALAGTFSSGSGSVRTFHAQVTMSGATAALRVQNGRGQLLVTGMPQPPPGRIYEVWEQRGAAAPQPTNALFGVSSEGSATVGVPGSLRGVRRVMVTDEPRGGSRVPTRQPVIVVAPT